MTTPANLDLVFSALANETRRAILARLCEGEATVNDLAEPFEMSLPAVSKHIRVLETAGLIDRGREAQFRPCRLNPEKIAEVSNWAEQYRPIWELRFDTMAQLLAQMKDADDD